MAEVVDVTGDGRVKGVSRAAAAIREGQVVVLPTDTVYGLAADAFNPDATANLFAAKGRDRRVPVPVFVRSPRQLAGLTTIVPEAVERLVAAYWPGPLTIVIRAEPNLRWDLGETEGAVAVRMPFDDVALAVIRAIGPLAVTAAGRGGFAPARTAEDALEQFGERVSVILDDGPREGGAASTIVDTTRAEPAILREGAVPSERVLAVARGERNPDDVAFWDESGGSPAP